MTKNGPEPGYHPIEREPRFEININFDKLLPRKKNSFDNFFFGKGCSGNFRIEGHFLGRKFCNVKVVVTFPLGIISSECDR